MAGKPRDPNKPPVKRGPMKPRPFIVAVRATVNAEGKPDVEIVAVTKDALAILELIENDPTIKTKKVFVEGPKRGGAATA